MRFVKTVENLFGLPQGFTRVEYLESSGTQYIDLGIGVKSNTVFKATFSIASTATGRSYFGARNSSNERFQIVDSIGIGSGYFYNANIYPIANQRYVIEMHANGDMYLDGVKRNASNGTFSQVAFERNLWLFATNYYNSSGVPGASTFWKAQIFEGDVLVRDFIPCIDPLGRACMYDLVGKKPYYNQGTGDFTTGRQIIPVEYLEGTGTQYIDTGITSNLNTFAEINLKVIAYSTNNTATFFGGLTSNVGISTNISKTNTDRYSRFGTKYATIKNLNIEGIKSTITINKNAFVINGQSYAVEETSSFNGPNMYLFKVAGVTSEYNTTTDIYSCQLWDNGVLVRDYIPCKDENDNGFLFDKVSGVCYLNNGTGNFAFGENKYKTKLRLIKDNKLPAGYTQVEYLESSGTQWIDTGIDVSIANTDVCKVITDFIVFTPPGATGLNAYTGIFGAGSPRFGAYAIYDKICFGYVSAFDNIQSFNFGQKYNLEYTVTKGSQEAKLDGASIWTATNTGTLTNAYKLGLFCRTQSSVQWIQNARIYNFKFYDNGTLIRDYIPALDPSGTPCMYDLVTKTPFYNQGTGTFSYGKTISMVRFIKDIVPREYATVNYIESTGTQYIDTGFKGNTTTTRYETKIVPTDITTTQGLFGSRNTVNISNNNNCEVFIHQSQFRLDWIDGTVGSFVPIKINTPYEIELTRGHGIINGVEYTSTQSSSIDQLYNFLIGNFTNGSSSPYSTGFIGKTYYGRLYNNGMLVRNFIPVVRRVDKVAGMWDTVTKQFFTTQVGAFNFG